MREASHGIPLAVPIVWKEFEVERESIADLIVRTLGMVKDAQAAAHKYNDFGSMLGIQDEATDLYEDLERVLHATCKRARRLKARIEKYESGDHSVPLLSSYSNTRRDARREGEKDNG